MTLIIEISRPFQWKPFKFSNSIMLRFGFGWIAIAWLRVPFREFSETNYTWEY